MLIGLFGKVVKFASGNVGLKLAIPGFRRKLLKPLRECGEIRPRQSRDLRFNFLNTHKNNLRECLSGRKLVRR
jgi:hypothetical protein